MVELPLLSSNYSGLFATKTSPKAADS